MKQFLLLCALCALAGCRTGLAPSAEAISLFCAASEPSKTEVLTAGEQVAVFAALEGTEHYFLEGEKFVVGSDGHTLTYGSAVYYPDPKQAVRFCAYFPYHTGAFSVPTDQGTPAALKQADLCWATASSTPVAAPVSLGFGHLMARLVVQTTSTPTKISVPNAVAGGTLDPATGAFQLNGNKSEVFTTGNELILPAQPLTRLLLTVSGVEYTYEGSVPLEAGKTTTLNLTLHPTDKTATLSGSSTAAWGTASGEGDPEAQVNNAFTMHYAPAPPNYAKADKITLTVQHPVTLASQDIDLVPTLVAGQSSTAACGYTFSMQLPMTASVPYPYVVGRVRLYVGATVLRDTPQKHLKGSLVYRSGAQTLAHHITIKVRDELTNTTEVKSWAGVMGGGEQQLVKVTVEGADTWTATATGTGLGAPASGANGAVGAIHWERNPSTTAGRSGSLTFSTVPSGAILTIPTNQLAQATPPNTIMVNGVAICTGNLIANGKGGCEIGAKTDFGLYFQFGSLVGWSGGANGDGKGSGLPPVEVKVMPTTMTTTPNWQRGSSSTLSTNYFSYTQGWWAGDSRLGLWRIGAFSVPMSGDSGSGNLQSGRYAALGVGDPCSYYLGAAYRTPTGDDFRTVLGGTHPYGGDWTHTGGWAWQGGAYHAATATQLINGQGMINAVVTTGTRSHYGGTGLMQTSSMYGNGDMSHMFSYGAKGDIGPFNAWGRYAAFPVRCVAN